MIGRMGTDGRQQLNRLGQIPARGLVPVEHHGDEVEVAQPLLDPIQHRFPLIGEASEDQDALARHRVDHVTDLPVVQHQVDELRDFEVVHGDRSFACGCDHEVALILDLRQVEAPCRHAVDPAP
jgi:hypothetical protein